MSEAVIQVKVRKKLFNLPLIDGSKFEPEENKARSYKKGGK
jgi:hypothetical protein